VKCSQLVIGSSGAVHGEITADKIRIHGAVTGKIISKTVFLSQTAKVKGDIVHESLAIEPGARVEGMCSRLNDESKRQLVSDATAEKKAAVKA
jgi:cytoskeletal protein CcmA (bactofilin family)